MRWIMTGGIVGLLALAAGAISLLLRPGLPSVPMNTDSPDALVDSAFAVVEAGRADLLADLIYAPDDDFRLVLDQFGLLLLDLQRLATLLAERYPDDIAALREAPGGGAAAMAMLGSRNGPPPGADRLLRRLMADPFAWARESRDRITTASIGDDSAAILVDGAPALGVGLVLRREDGRWWVELPTGLPMIQQYMPQTTEEFQILASLVRVVDNAVLDLTQDIERGKCADLSEASRLAGEKAFGPLVMCFVAYDRAMKARAP